MILMDAEEEYDAVITKIVGEFASCRSPLEAIHSFTDFLSFLVHEGRNDGESPLAVFQEILMFMAEIHDHPGVKMYCRNEETYVPNPNRSLFNED